MRPGLVVWLTGLPGAGKTTLALAAAEALAREEMAVEALDGAEFREVFEEAPPDDPRARETHTLRLAAVAALLARHGVLVLVASTTPTEALRAMVRQAVGLDLVEVFVDCPRGEARVRDTKGLYRRAEEGAISGLPGGDAVFEPPKRADLIINTAELDPTRARERLIEFIEKRRAAADIKERLGDLGYL